MENKRKCLVQPLSRDHKEAIKLLRQPTCCIEQRSGRYDRPKLRGDVLDGCGCGRNCLNFLKLLSFPTARLFQDSLLLLPPPESPATPAMLVQIDEALMRQSSHEDHQLLAFLQFSRQAHSCQSPADSNVYV